VGMLASWVASWSTVVARSASSTTCQISPHSAAFSAGNLSASMPTKALVRTRQALHAAPNHTLEQQLSMEGGFMRELGWSHDFAEGVAAFMEKRTPRFTGE
jgi:enoyl-CoA hydratase/carnithine racemase